MQIFFQPYIYLNCCAHATRSKLAGRWRHGGDGCVAYETVDAVNDAKVGERREEADRDLLDGGDLGCDRYWMSV